MTAEPLGPVVWAPDPVKQQKAGYTIEDVLSLPDEAPRVELSDGVLLVVPSPTAGHQRLNWRLATWLERHVPKGFEPQMAVGVVIDHTSTLEPDALILYSPVDPGHHYFGPDQVVVAVEIVSPGTRKRDRFEKPGAYAAAGIQHFWRIELNPVHIFAYDLAGGRYELVADSAEELVLDRPFEIRLPIRELAS
ncbi:Uma2 family endonuclease [Actinoplanes sp. NPDC023936]|uniref:Uma2 family endonuclease n=1 Tax=Actinoplanes sp. NPDC023936 TaxID=3154910 RepID=UPI0033E31B0B